MFDVVLVRVFGLVSGMMDFVDPNLLVAAGTRTRTSTCCWKAVEKIDVFGDVNAINASGKKIRQGSLMRLLGIITCSEEGSSTGV